MDKDRSSKPAAGGVARSDPDDPHRYKMPITEKLSAKDEKAIGLTIQSASRAIEALTDSIWAKLNRYLDGLALAPLSTPDVKSLARDELAKVIRSMAASQPDAAAFAARLRQRMCIRMAASVEGHAESARLLQ